MSQDDLERRLRDELRYRTADVDPQLSGPQLRRRAADGDTPRARPTVAMLAAAAAVVAIATTGAVIATSGGEDRTPVQPGGTPGDRGSTHAPSVSPTPPSSTPRRIPVLPSVSGTPRPPTSPGILVSPTSTPDATPDATPSGTAQPGRPRLRTPPVRSSSPDATGRSDAPTGGR